jgi:hypothetical protein
MSSCPVLSSGSHCPPSELLQIDIAYAIPTNKRLQNCADLHESTQNCTVPGHAILCSGWQTMSLSLSLIVICTGLHMKWWEILCRFGQQFLSVAKVYKIAQYGQEKMRRIIKLCAFLWSFVTCWANTCSFVQRAHSCPPLHKIRWFRSVLHIDSWFCAQHHEVSWICTQVQELHVFSWFFS